MGCPRPDRRFVILAVGFGFIYLSTILIIVGLCTNNWKEIWDGNVNNDRIEVHFGLHRVCFSDGARCNNPGNSYDQQNYLPAIQGLTITGGLFALIASLFALVNMLSDRVGWTKIGISIPSSVCAFISCLFEMIGCILFSAKVEINNEYISFYRDIRLGWSFGLTACSVGLLFFGGVLMGLSALSKPTSKFV